MRRTPLILFVGAALALLSGCGKWFDVSPYDAEPPDDLLDLTATNTVRIQDELSGHQGTLTFALTSDPHYHYGDLNDIVEHMRADASIRFVVVPGDLTDQGLIGEFVWFARTMQELTVPWIALIGNHDHLGNGRSIYESMFGPRNVVMDVAGYRFILFDDTVWESDMPPDMVWLQAALNGAGERIPIVITHIPPFTDQMVGVHEEPFRTMVAVAEVPLVLHGHLHRFKDFTPYQDGVRYVCVPWPKERAYVKVILDGGEFQIEVVEL